MTEPTAPRHQPPWQLPPPVTRRKLSQGAIAWITVGACVAVLGGTVLLGAITAGFLSGPTRGNASRDVRITACETTAAGNASASLKVTNSSRRTRTYWVTVAFLDRDQVQLATGVSVMSNVGPGASAVDDVIGFLPSSRSDLGQCRITKVTAV